jgi:hypothetical protein
VTIELIPLCTARITFRPPVVLEGTPRGTRAVIEMTDVVYEGERLSGRLVGPAAVDWLLIGPDGSNNIDVAFTIRTDDDALVYVHYYGRSDGSDGPGAHPLYAAPVFETGDPRYLWLNKIMAVGKAVVTDDVIDYEIYEVR